MFCESCGKKNPKEASFCGFCGKPIAINDKKEDKANKYLKAFKELPKKTKVVMTSVTLIVIIFLVVLGFLLNNPLKKLEDNLAHYYDFYSENNTKELMEIGKLITTYKDKKSVLNNIKETTKHITSIWVKNFNTSYKNKEHLETSYNKLSKVLSSLYNYYNGLEYILNYDLYRDYMEEIDKLYASKKAYLEALEYENKKDEYYAYYYYQKVVEEDSYYHLANKYITNYIKEEVTEFQKAVEELIDTTSVNNSLEKLDIYLSGLEYLDKNKVVNNIDLSNSDEYKKLYNDILDKVVATTKLVIDDLDKDANYNKGMEIIDKVLDSIDSESDSYKELEKIKEDYKNILPVSLIGKLISSTNGFIESKYAKIINNTEYKTSLELKFNNTKVSGAYKLNKEYKTLKMQLVWDLETNRELKGTICIYGDNKELYKSDKILEINEIEINVSDIDNLRIEFLGENTYDSNVYIYLVEPYLYR